MARICRPHLSRVLVSHESRTAKQFAKGIGRSSYDEGPTLYAARLGADYWIHRRICLAARAFSGCCAFIIGVYPKGRELYVTAGWMTCKSCRVLKKEVLEARCERVFPVVEWVPRLELDIAVTALQVNANWAPKGRKIVVKNS